MKYERKSPYADGFNDIYTVAGVDADDVWARKRMLLGGDGGGGGGGDAGGVNTGHDQNVGPGDIGFSAPGTSSPGVSDPDSGDTSTSGGFGSATAAEAQAAANEAGITGFSATNADTTIGADPSMGQPGSGFGSISAGPPGTNAEAEAEAAAISAAIGEMDAYDAQVALGPIARGFNLFSPIDITKTHDQYGRGVYGLDISIPGVVGGLIGGPVGMALGTLGPTLGRGLGIETNVNVGPQGITTGFSTPTGIESAIGNAIGMDMSPGGLGSIGVGPGGSQDSATGTTGGTTTGTQGSVTDGIGGFDTSGNSDPAFEAMDLSSDTMLGRTLVEKDLDPGGDASAIIPVPINTSAAPAGIFQVAPTTRPLAYAPSPSPFFQQQNFNPFAVPLLGVPTQTAPFVQPMRYGGAVNSGIGSLVSIR